MNKPPRDRLILECVKRDGDTEERVYLDGVLLPRPGWRETKLGRVVREVDGTFRIVRQDCDITFTVNFYQWPAYEILDVNQIVRVDPEKNYARWYPREAEPRAEESSDERDEQPKAASEVEPKPQQHPSQKAAEKPVVLGGWTTRIGNSIEEAPESTLQEPPHIRTNAISPLRIRRPEHPRDDLRTWS